MEILSRFINNESGEGFVWILILLFLSAVVLGVGLELYRDYSLKESITTELNRAGNMSISFSMQDDYRNERIAKIDSDIAQFEFLGYLTDKLLFTGSYPHYYFSKDGFEYEIIFSSLSVTEEPPLIICSAMLLVKPIFNIFVPDSFYVELPISVRTKNVRIGEFS